jgi:hypothetical protein
MTSPLVNVVLPVRNGAADLPKGFELIVVSDGSTDGTAAVLDKIDLRVRVVHQENNKGLCRGSQSRRLTCARPLHSGPRRLGEANATREAGGVESRLRPGRHLRGRPEQVVAWANDVDRTVKLREFQKLILHHELFR